MYMELNLKKNEKNENKITVHDQQQIVHKDSSKQRWRLAFGTTFSESLVSKQGEEGV